MPFGVVNGISHQMDVLNGVHIPQGEGKGREFQGFSPLLVLMAYF